VPGLRHPLDVLSRLSPPPALTGHLPPSPPPNGERGRGGAFVPPLAGAAIAFALVASTLLRRSDALLLPAYDTAFFQQVAWNLGHGRGFVSDFFPASFLGLHFSPLLALPAALELAWPDARMLALLHAAAIAATAPAAFLLLGELVPNRWLAAALAAPVPLWAALQQAAWAGFHPEAIALPLVLLAAWAGLTGRTAACWGLALAALTAREDQAYAVAVVGALLWSHGPSRRQGAAVGLVAVAWGALVSWAVMPALRGGVESQLEPYYQWLRTASPGAVALALANPAGWLAFAGLVAGLAALPLLRPGWLALALPPLAADLLSAHHPQPELRLQYALPLVVPLLVAAGLGARSLPLSQGEVARQRRRGLPLALPAGAVAAFAAPALLVGLLAGPLLAPGAGAGPPALGRLLACTATLPALAPVAADDDAAAPLASRPALRLTPEAEPGDWVVVDRQGHLPSYVWLPDRDRALAALPGQGRRLRCDDGRFQVWGPAGA
jgi:Predicted membrane protein (DUF2079)